MKNVPAVILFITCAAAIQISRASTPPLQEEAPDAVDLFYASLSPYGEWIELQAGLYAWHPFNVDPAWRPYTLGRWVWSDYGWYWVSAEPFGWATYHYGRWYCDEVYGWIWIPDNVWGPGWVEWRNNDDYIGWAPLPPYARFHVTVGIRFTRRWVAPPVYWSFISFDHFVSNRPYHNYAAETTMQRLISTTRSTGRYRFDQNRIINQGVDRTFIQRRTSNRIETADIAETREQGVERISSNGRGVRIEIYRPRPDDAGVTRHVVARKAVTRPSLDIEHVEPYRSVPQRGTGSLEGRATRSEQALQAPNRQTLRTNRASRSEEKQNVNRERFERSQPRLPVPKVHRNDHNRKDNKDGERSRGRKRDRF